MLTIGFQHSEENLYPQQLPNKNSGQFFWKKLGLNAMVVIKELKEVFQVTRFLHSQENLHGVIFIRSHLIYSLFCSHTNKDNSLWYVEQKDQVSLKQKGLELQLDMLIHFYKHVKSKKVTRPINWFNLETLGEVSSGKEHGMIMTINIGHHNSEKNQEL